MLKENAKTKEPTLSLIHFEESTILAFTFLFCFFSFLLNLNLFIFLIAILKNHRIYICLVLQQV